MYPYLVSHLLLNKFGVSAFKYRPFYVPQLAQKFTRGLRTLDIITDLYLHWQIVDCAFVIAALYNIVPAIAAPAPTAKVAKTCRKIGSTRSVRLPANHDIIRMVEPALSHFTNAATP